MPSVIVRLQSSWSYYPCGDGQIELACIPRGQRVRLDAITGLQRALDALGNGINDDRAAHALAEASGLSVLDSELMIGRLDDVGALVRRSPENDVKMLDGTTLYDRQVRFLSFYETASTSGTDLNHKLQNRSVVIPGIGGLGGWIALLCARLGIRKIIGIDPDRVELSNLHRQILYTRDDIGKLKVDAAAFRLAEVDPDIEFVGHATWITDSADALPLIEGSDLVINNFPFLPSFIQASHGVAAAALQARVPCLNMPMAQCIGPLTVPGVTACFCCAWEQLSHVYQVESALRASSPVGTHGGFLGALAPRQAIAGGLAAWEALRFLSGMDRAPTLDGIVFFDIGAYRQHQFVSLSRADQCSACGEITPSVDLGALASVAAANDPEVWRQSRTLPSPELL